MAAKLVIPLELQFGSGKLDEILTVLKDILKELQMNKSELATALTGVAATLTGVGEQLTKATAEIVEALSNAGFTDPAIDGAVASLQLMAATLEQASQGLDDLNPDAPV